MKCITLLVNIGYEYKLWGILVEFRVSNTAWTFSKKHVKGFEIDP